MSQVPKHLMYVFEGLTKQSDMIKDQEFQLLQCKKVKLQSVCFTKFYWVIFFSFSGNLTLKTPVPHTSTLLSFHHTSLQRTHKLC